MLKHQHFFSLKLFLLSLYAKYIVASRPDTSLFVITEPNFGVTVETGTNLTITWMESGNADLASFEDASSVLSIQSAMPGLTNFLVASNIPLATMQVSWNVPMSTIPSQYYVNLTTTVTPVKGGWIKSAFATSGFFTIVEGNNVVSTRPPIITPTSTLNVQKNISVPLPTSSTPTGNVSTPLPLIHSQSVNMATRSVNMTTIASTLPTTANVTNSIPISNTTVPMNTSIPLVDLTRFNDTSNDSTLPIRPTETTFGVNDNPFPSDPLVNFSLPTISPTYLPNVTNLYFSHAPIAVQIQSTIIWNFFSLFVIYHFI